MLRRPLNWPPLTPATGEWPMRCALCGQSYPWKHYPVRHEAVCACCYTAQETHAEFEIRGWRARLRVLFTGKASRVYAKRAPVLVHERGNVTSLDRDTLDTLPELRYLPRPSLIAEWLPPQH